MRARTFLLLLALAGLAGAGDLVHMRNGRILRGRVVSEEGGEIVLDLGAGRIVLPAGTVGRIERNADPAPVPRLVTRRDDWFFLLHGETLVGWRRVVETEGGDHRQIEERTVLFGEAGVRDIETRRVEITGADGTPREFLLMRTSGPDDASIVSGQVVDGSFVLQIRRDGAFRTEERALPEGCVLALPVWSGFLADAEVGEERRVTAFDPGRLAAVGLRMCREADAADPAGIDGRPWGSFRLEGEVPLARVLYRPGDGALQVALEDTSLVARRTTPERVAIARRAHAPPPPLTIRQAQMYPFHERTTDLACYHPRAGVVLHRPDAGWKATVVGAEQGRVLALEKEGIFATFEVFAYPAPDATAGPEACMEDALRRVRRTVERVAGVERKEEARVADRPARERVLRVHHRGETLHCRVIVVPDGARYLLFLAAAPMRWWPFAERDFGVLLEGAEIA